MKKKFILFFQTIFNSSFNKLGLFFSIFYFYWMLKNDRLISNEQEFFKLKSFVKKNSSVIDVGANIGRYTFALSKIVGQKGFVYSFEPMCRSFLILNSLVFLSNLKNIILFKSALGNRNEKILMKELYIYKNNPFLFDTNTGSYVIKKMINLTNNNLINYALKLDDLCIKDKISFIKIDIEGNEYEFLLGAKNLIKKNKPILLIEIHNNFNKVLKLLYKLNYKEKFYFKNSRNRVFYYGN